MFWLCRSQTLQSNRFKNTWCAVSIPRSSVLHSCPSALRAGQVHREGKGTTCVWRASNVPGTFPHSLPLIPQSPGQGQFWAPPQGLEGTDALNPFSAIIPGGFTEYLSAGLGGSTIMVKMLLNWLFNFFTAADLRCSLSVCSWLFFMCLHGPAHAHSQNYLWYPKCRSNPSAHWWMSR